MDRYTANLYKFWAILLIVLHNFFNSVEMRPHLGMNEFSFSSNRLLNLFDIVIHDALSSIHAFFIFFGHYGVQVFVFVSAYGLTKKFSQQDRLGYFRFQLSRLNKLYLPFLLAMILYVLSLVARIVLYGDVVLDETLWVSLFLKSTLVYNLVPNEVFSLVGPWWFLSFIFQFYLIYPFIYKLISGKYIKLAIAIFLLLFINEVLLTDFLRENGLYIKTTVFGQYQVIYFGVIAALIKFTPGLYSLVVSVCMLVLGNMFEPLWYLSHFFSLITFLSLVEILRNNLVSFKMPEKLVNYMAAISVYLFLVNGFTRAPFNKWAYDSDSPIFTLAMAGVSLSFAVIMAVFLYKVEKLLRLYYRKYL
ncbi:MAG: acyltransferase [Gammaproteobacteria bacterium]|nr:acyltransferase [Gammaproteobacteria bacterium]